MCATRQEDLCNKPESEEDSDDEEKDQPERVEEDEKDPAEPIVFEAIPVTQVVCNFARTITVAKSRPCTKIGKKLAANFVRVAATRIFTDPYQSIMELVSNAIDACTFSKASSIGRFGMGFFSIFGLLLSTKDFEKVLISTTQEKTFELVIVVRNGELTATLRKTDKAGETGTIIRLESRKKLKSEVKTAIQNMVKRFKYSTSVNIIMDGEKVCGSNSRDKHLIGIVVQPRYFVIADSGSGMNLDNLRGLLTPSVSTKGLQTRETGDVVIAEDPPRCLVQAAQSNSLVICVNGVQIKVVESGVFSRNGTLSVMLLPASTKLPVGRNDVILSHQATFDHVRTALEQLFNEHMARKNVAALRSLIRTYAKQSLQIEAFRLVQRLDELILQSDAVLIPDKSPSIVKVCKKLELDFVVSDLFKFTQLQRQILQAAKREWLDEKTFKHRTAIVTNALEDPVETIPCLSGVVFVRKNAKKQQLEDYSQNSSNGCMTTHQYDVWSSHGLGVAPIGPFVAQTTFKKISETQKAELLRREQVILNHPTFITANKIWQLKFAVANVELLGSHIAEYAKLWTFVEMDLDSFDEVTAMLVAKLSGSKVTIPYEEGNYFIFGQANSLIPMNLLPKFKRNRLVSSDLFFVQEPIPKLELELLKFKIETFPDQIGVNDAIARFHSDNFWQLCGFAQLAVEWSAYALSEYVCGVFEACNRNSIHILETFVVALIAYCYFEAFAMDADFVQYVVGHIRQELRKNVSLDQIIRLFTSTIWYGNFQVPFLAIATIFTPIYVTFPLLASSKDDHGIGDFRFINKWLDQEKQRQLCKFTVNDLMMFAYKEESLKSASQFMNPDVLAALEAFAVTNNGECDIQAILIAANFGTTKPVVESMFTELFQNSCDAMMSSDLSPEEKNILIHVNRRQFHFLDPVGIPFAKLMTLLLPFYSEKTRDKNVSGEMGTGFFNLFRLNILREVKIATKFKSETGVTITATPMRNDEGFVYNVQVLFETLPEKADAGTEVIGYFNTTCDRVNLLTQMYLHCRQNFHFAPFPVRLNGTVINQDIGQEVFSVKNVLSVRGFTTGLHAIPSIITINNVPFGLLRDYWSALTNTVHENVSTKNSSHAGEFEILQEATQTNLCLEIARDQLQAVQSRDKLIIKNKEQMKNLVLQGQLMWLLRLYANGKVEDLIPHTNSKQSLSQIKFLEPPYIVGSKLDSTWMPTSFKDFFSVLHWVMNKVMESGDANVGEKASKIIDALQIKVEFKDALNRWFLSKKLSADEARKIAQQMEQGGVPKFLEGYQIIGQNLYTVELVLSAYIKACVDTFNFAKLTLTKYDPQDPNEKMVIVSRTSVPRIVGCVNDDVLFKPDGVYVPSKNCLLLSKRHREMSRKLLTAIKPVSTNKLRTLFPELLNEHFFSKSDRIRCPMVHELVHHMCNDEHTSVAHPMLSLAVKGKQCYKESYNSVVNVLHGKLMDAGLNNNFLNNLIAKKLVDMKGAE